HRRFRPSVALASGGLYARRVGPTGGIKPAARTLRLRNPLVGRERIDFSHLPCHPCPNPSHLEAGMQSKENLAEGSLRSVAGGPAARHWQPLPPAGSPGAALPFRAPSAG